MQKRDVQFLSFTLLALYLILVIRNAWTSDDSFITFRLVENFLAGCGPVYNPTMRVQGFTHPLWMFLIAASYFIAYHSHLTFGDGPVFPTLFLSILCSSLGVFLAMRKIVKNELLPLLLLFAPLVLSRAFIDYSTSGLENPLTDLLLVLFIWKFNTGQYDSLLKAYLATLTPNHQESE